MSAVIFNDVRDQLLADYRLAQECKQAQQTFLWKWLISNAASEADEAKAALVLVNPHDTKEIMRLQLIAQRCLGLETWMNNVIQAGAQAERDFQARQEETGGYPLPPED